MIQKPPKGLLILAFVGPSFIWCGEYIATGEVILATRVGAILGPTVLWAVIIGIFLKFWIGLSGAQYTVCTGEGMIDMFRRIPGPRNWVVWIVLVVQLIAATVSIGALAVTAGVFVNSLIPIGPTLSGWLVALFALSVVWSGLFKILQMVMSILAFTLIPRPTAVDPTGLCRSGVQCNTLSLLGKPFWAGRRAYICTNGKVCPM